MSNLGMNRFSFNSIYCKKFSNLEKIYIKTTFTSLDVTLIEKVEKIINLSKVCDFLGDIPDIKNIIIIKFNPSELVLSLQQKERDCMFDMKEQIEYFSALLPNNISIYPYKTRRTVYKFRISLKDYQLSD